MKPPQKPPQPGHPLFRQSKQSSQQRGPLAAVAQPKIATPATTARQPVAPPVYRPQPVPRVLQKKSALSQSQTAPLTRQPAAPPVYRPQPVPKVLQQKSAVNRPATTAPSTPRPNVPPISRTPSKKVAQPQAKVTPQRPRLPRVPLPTGRNIIQGVFKFGDKLVQNPIEAMKLLQQELQQVTKPVSEALAKTVIFNLPSSETITLKQLVYIYRKLEKLIRGRLEQAEKDRDELTLYMKSSANMEAREAIVSGPLPNGCSRIFRGATPWQTKRIISNCTFGGTAPNPQQDRLPPTERDAQLQTGENVKEAQGGNLEEWSVKPGGLTGFASEGFMLVALVKNQHARFPPPQSMIGEMGVTGWSDQSLVRVAIYEPGRSLSLSPDATFIDAATRFTKNLAEAKKTVLGFYAKTKTPVPIVVPQQQLPPPVLQRPVSYEPERIPTATIPLPRGIDQQSFAEFRRKIWGEG